MGGWWRTLRAWARRTGRRLLGRSQPEAGSDEWLRDYGYRPTFSPGWSRWRDWWTVEDYRRVFWRAPLGSWSAAVGSFAIVMNQTWQFRPDHTGETNFYSGRNGRCRTTFEWREAGERTVEVRQLSYEEEYPDPEENEDAQAEDEGEQEEWVAIAYDFIPVRNEAGGRSVVMVDVDAEREAFGSIFGFFPVSFDGEPHQAGQ